MFPQNVFVITIIILVAMNVPQFLRAYSSLWTLSQTAMGLCNCAWALLLGKTCADGLCFSSGIGTVDQATACSPSPWPLCLVTVESPSKAPVCSICSTCLGTLNGQGCHEKCQVGYHGAPRSNPLSFPPCGHNPWKSMGSRRLLIFF